MREHRRDDGRVVPEDIVDARHELLKLQKTQRNDHADAIEPAAALPLCLRLRW